MRILFSFEDTKTTYDIEKHLGIPHASAHDAIKQLLELDIIRISKETRFRTGLSRKEFSITELGKTIREILKERVNSK